MQPKACRSHGESQGTLCSVNGSQSGRLQRRCCKAAEHLSTTKASGPLEATRAFELGKKTIVAYYNQAHRGHA